MRVVTSDDTGFVTRVECTLEADSAAVVRRYREQNRSTVPLCFCFANNESETAPGDSHLYSALKDGSVELLSLETGARSVVLEMGTFGTHTPVSLQRSASSLVAADQSGEVRLWSVGEDFSIDASSATSFKACNHADAMRVCAEAPSIVAIGGLNTDLFVWDIENTDKFIFKSKNVKPDKLLLHAPKHIVDIAFRPHTGSSQIVTGTKFKEVRLYDRKAQLRPVFNITIGEYSVGALTVSHNGNEVIVGDVAGDVTSYDLRTGKAVAKFKGLVGACRAIQCHPTLDYVAACGLDRHVRIFNINTRRCVRKLYLKTRMCGLLFSPDERVAKETPARKSGGEKPSSTAALGSEEDEDEGDADDDELWAELDTASAKKREEAVRAVKSKVKQPKSTEAERTGGKREKKRKQSAKDAQSNAATIASAAPEKQKKKEGKKAPTDSSMMPMLASVTGLDETHTPKKTRKK